MESATSMKSFPAPATISPTSARESSSIFYQHTATRGIDI
jgi:hypothetical protein